MMVNLVISGDIMRLFQKRYQCTLTQKELESVIASAIVKAKSEIENNEKAMVQKDPLSGSIRLIICVVLGIISLVLIATACVAIVSIFWPNIEALKEMYRSSVCIRCIMAVVLIADGICIFMIAKAVYKETNREFLISFFSAVISVISLLVVLYVK
jgi:uncharacterized membrane protein